MRPYLYPILLSLISIACTHGERSEEAERAHANTRKESAFRGSYLQIPPGTKFKSISSIKFEALKPASLATTAPSLVKCQMYRKKVSAPLKRLYDIPAETNFKVVGVQNDMPLDQGEGRDKLNITKAGPLLLISTEDPEENIQEFGIGCERTGKNPERPIAGQSLRASFDAEIFKDVEIIP